MSAYPPGPETGGRPQGQPPGPPPGPGHPPPGAGRPQPGSAPRGTGLTQQGPPPGRPGTGLRGLSRHDETKAAFRTTELIAYLATVIGVLIASAVVDENGDGQGFGAARAWLYVTLLTIGYLVSRGLAKSGSRGDGR
jgi:hypothetical protein